MEEDERWMGLALKEAEKAYAEDEIPVGAVIVYGHRVIGRGHNRIEGLKDPTAHAEIIAIGAAAGYLGSWRLTGTTLYVTLEPCAMCAGAIVLARIDRLVFSVYDPKAGACGSLMNIVQDGRFNHRVEVMANILPDECGSLLRAFFKKLRSKRQA